MVGFLSREIEQGIVRQTDAELLSALIIGGGDIMAQMVTLDDKYTENKVLTFWFDCVLRIIRPDNEIRLSPGNSKK
jgi:hypothetical protein